MALPNLNRIERASVQELPDANENPFGSGFWGITQRGYNLAAWGTREREKQLRAYYRHEYNWMGQSAFSGLNKKWAAAPWEISGNRRVSYFQELLRQAHFGAGWDVFLQRVGLDFLRQDGGAYIEIIAPGNPRRAPTGPVMGLAHLDSLRCFPTGDPEFPVLYYDVKGRMHLLHHTRVVHLVDAPDGDEGNPGYGLCAMSRAIAIITQQIHMMRYVQTTLDDKPQPGYIVASGITSGQRDTAFRLFSEEQGRDEQPPWGRTVWFHSLDPAQQIKLEAVTFATAPEKFDFKAYTELHINAWALALGVDVQELWQLTGGNLGSGQQSEVLHAKSQGKTFGAFLTRLERAINDILPDSLAFEFKVRDPYEAQERAQSAQIWAGVAASIGENMTPDEKRRMLANQVEAVFDAITDEQGEIMRLPDVDPKEEGQTDDGSAPEQTANDDTNTERGERAIQATRLDFESAFEDVVHEAQGGELDRRRFGVLMRGMLRRYGLEAYRDGLADGGVASRELDVDDQARFTALLARQSAFVTNFAGQLYGDGLSDAQVAQRAAMWFNKSISPFYEAGRLSADRNGLYEFAGDDGDATCATCARLKGQRHRMKDWARKQLRPRVDTHSFECGGYQCRHALVKVQGRAQGRF